jgi:polyhydroxybutyrate depolymerase
MKKWIGSIAVVTALFSHVGFSQSSTRALHYHGLERSYRLHLPGAEDVNTPRPLLVALHGAGSNGTDFEKRTGFSPLADREGFVVVYPNSTGTRGRQWNSMWNWGETPDDSGFIAALIDSLLKEYALDPQRVFVTGHSGGAFMAYRVANEYPEKIAAIAANAGLVGLQGLRAGPPVSILHIHGTDDMRIPLTGMPQHGYPSVAEGLGWWIRRNGCASEPETRNIDGKVTVTTWNAPHRTGDVALYIIDDSGHSWPKAPSQIDASTAIWEFFKHHPRTSNEPTVEEMVWTATADLPSPLSPSGAFALDGKIYVLGGRQNAAQKDVDLTLEYDPHANRWTRKKALPFKSHLHTIAPLDGKLYLISSDMQENYRYDPHTDSSEAIAPNPDKRIPGSCVPFGGKVYVMGGIHNIIFDLSGRIDVYDPQTDQWSQKKPMPRLRLGLCVAVNDKILVIGGWEPVSGQRRVRTSSAVQLYDPATEAWETRQDLPFGVVGSAVIVGSKVYVMGCVAGEIPGKSEDLTTVLVYDTTKDTWQRTTPLPRLAVGAGFAVLDDSIHLIGGCAGQQHGWTDYASTFRGDIMHVSEH